MHLPADAGFTANITIDGEFRPDAATLPEIAEESVEHLRGAVAQVTVAERREVGSADAPGLTQTLTFPAVVGGESRDLVQSQVYMAVLDVTDPHKRAVIRLVLTATASQYRDVLDDFRDFVRTVRPSTDDTAS